jgi:L-ribulose-5-phosphate 4-epimerase
MLLKDLRIAVLEANLELVKRGLVLYTFGNASGIDRERGLVVIKPSGVDYDELRPEHMVVTDLDGKVVDGELKPSSDLETHTNSAVLARLFIPIRSMRPALRRRAWGFRRWALRMRTTSMGRCR